MQAERTPTTVGEKSNTARAIRAQDAVITYDGAEREYSADDQDQAHQVIKDLLGDLRHLCDRVGVDFDAADLAAARMYEQERTEDQAGDWPLWGEGFEVDAETRAAADAYGVAIATAQTIARHVEAGTEDEARDRFGDDTVDDWFRSQGVDPDAARAEIYGGPEDAAPEILEAERAAAREAAER